MEQWANDPAHGYDQEYRWGERGDYDCSSAVISAWKAAGIDLHCTYTGNMKDDFIKHGFEVVTHEVNLTTGNGLLRGDVLLNEVHHTAMYIGEGMEVEASINEKGGATGGQPGDQTGREILIRAYRNYPWDCVLRYRGTGKEVVEPTPKEKVKSVKANKIPVPYVQIGCTGAMVAMLQEALNQLGYDLDVDGEFGMLTDSAVKDYQKKRGITVSGLCGVSTFRQVMKDISKKTYKD